VLDLKHFKMAWTLLDTRERRVAVIVLGLTLVAALFAALMVGSILPFLTVLADPTRIHSVPILASIYNQFNFTTDFQFLIALGVASLLVILVGSALQIVRTWAVARFVMMRIHALSNRLLAGYLHQPYEFFLHRHSGALSTKVLAESQQVVMQFFKPISDIIASGLTILAVVAILVAVNPAVALIAFGIFGGAYGAVLIFSRRTIKRLGQQRLKTNQERYKIVNEALGGIKSIKISGREDFYANRYKTPSHEMASALASISVLQETPQYAMQVIAFGGGIMLSLVLLNSSGSADAAGLAEILPLLGVFALGAQRMIPEFSKFFAGVVQIQAGTPAVESIYKDLGRTTTSSQVANVQTPPLRFTRELRLEQVSYQYPGSNQAGLDQITLTIKAGEKIGIIGSTGAGKTTLGDVIMGLLRPQSGQIFVDGTALTDDNLRAWQRSLGYVPQEIFLADVTITENIALGLSSNRIDMERVQRAAEIAQIDRLVRDTLPDGYDTRIGERGVRLSGGQRQRIGIARALYHDADLIIFDEATSALDNLTERDVMEAIEALPGAKSVVMIAHRLTTLRKCDRIVLLKQGRVSAIGSWDELARNNEEFGQLLASVEAA